MAEYHNVENPLLEKLKVIGWDVIDHGGFAIPRDLASSLCSLLRK